MDPMTAMALAKAGGAVFGAVQAARGKQKMKEADKMASGEQDLISSKVALEEAKTKTKQIEAGTDATTQEALKSADQSTAATQKQLAGVTGGNVPGTVSALLQAQKMGGNIKNQAFAKAGERGIIMGKTANEIRKNIEDKVIALKDFKSVQRRAEGAEGMKSGMGNLMAGAFGSLPTDGGDATGDMGVFGALQQKYGGGGATTATTPSATTPSLATPTFSASNPMALGANDPNSPFFKTNFGYGTPSAPASSVASAPLSLGTTTFAGGPSVLPKGFGQ
jgi:hypothetical protein